MNWIYGYLAVGALVALWFVLTVSEEDLGEPRAFFPLAFGAVFHLLLWPLELIHFLRAMARGEL